MTKQCPLLVYTDLDGTLIDHTTYQWSAAQPALDAVRDAGGAVILASSKTAAEVAPLQRDLKLTGFPAIIENGAGVLMPKTMAKTTSPDYCKIRTILDAMSPNIRDYFRGFGDMTVAEVAAVTGLPTEAALLAKDRSFSEPGLWSGTSDDRLAFEAELAKSGVSAQMGGRFLTLSFGCKKSDHMTAINALYQPKVTIALGDAPNDIEMLEAADFGVVVANPYHAPLPQLAGEAEGRITRTKTAGPQGWNTAVLDLLAQLELNRN